MTQSSQLCSQQQHKQMLKQRMGALCRLRQCLLPCTVL